MYLLIPLILKLFQKVMFARGFIRRAWLSVSVRHLREETERCELKHIVTSFKNTNFKNMKVIWSQHDSYLQIIFHYKLKKAGFSSVEIAKRLYSISENLFVISIPSASIECLFNNFHFFWRMGLKWFKIFQRQISLVWVQWVCVWKRFNGLFFLYHYLYL